MAARNDITNDEIKSKVNTPTFRDGIDRIFGEKKSFLIYSGDHYIKTVRAKSAEEAVASLNASEPHDLTAQEK